MFNANVFDDVSKDIKKKIKNEIDSSAHTIIEENKNDQNKNVMVESKTIQMLDLREKNIPEVTTKYIMKVSNDYLNSVINNEDDKDNFNEILDNYLYASCSNQIKNIINQIKHDKKNKDLHLKYLHMIHKCFNIPNNFPSFDEFEDDLSFFGLIPEAYFNTFSENIIKTDLIKIAKKNLLNIDEIVDKIAKIKENSHYFSYLKTKDNYRLIDLISKDNSPSILAFVPTLKEESERIINKLEIENILLKNSETRLTEEELRFIKATFDVIFSKENQLEEDLEKDMGNSLERQYVKRL